MNKELTIAEKRIQEILGESQKRILVITKRALNQKDHLCKVWQKRCYKLSAQFQACYLCLNTKGWDRESLICELCQEKSHDWLPISYECGWKGAAHIPTLKKEFASRDPKEPFYHDEIIINCGGCGAIQGIRKSCVYGNCEHRHNQEKKTN